MSKSSKILNMQSIVGIILIIFVFLFGTIILFGLINTVDTGFNTSFIRSLNQFKELYFMFVAGILGIVYLSNLDSLKTKMEHALIIISIILFSVSLATLAGTLKTIYDTNYNQDYAQSYAQLQVQNTYYLQYTQWLVNITANIHSKNMLLESDIKNLTEKMNSQATVSTVSSTPTNVGNVATSPTETFNTINTVPVDDNAYNVE